MHNLDIMKENGVYGALYNSEPMVAVGAQYDYDYYESISKRPTMVDWGLVTEDHPETSQE